jgi:hypothetical protein
VTDLFSLSPEAEQADMINAVLTGRSADGLKDRDRTAASLARATDPETSKQAARRAAVRIQLSHANCILGALYKPMIPPEIGRVTGLSVVQIDRRRKELLERNEIRLTGVEREGYQEWERCES